MSKSAMLEVHRFLKFALVGAATAAIYFLVLAFHLEVLKANYNLAVSIAYFVSVIFQFIANKRFTFKSETASVLPQFSKFLALLFINYLVTIIVVTFVVEKLGLTAYYGVLASIPLIMAVGYLLSKHWIFKKGYVRG
jgi:putative flippase GtrA